MILLSMGVMSILTTAYVIWVIVIPVFCGKNIKTSKKVQDGPTPKSVFGHVYRRRILRNRRVQYQRQSWTQDDQVSL